MTDARSMPDAYAARIAACIGLAMRPVDARTDGRTDGLTDEWLR